jgi:hypothetical protein
VTNADFAGGVHCEGAAGAVTSGSGAGPGGTGSGDRDVSPAMTEISGLAAGVMMQVVLPS